ncbi:hypothetical protein QUF72_14740 [Desulfobacterales bacterium HSG2]|nr:hypothetical protein [Desulfobacterales bacterium HSG2]
MPLEFTEEDRRREQERLHEAWLRDQRTREHIIRETFLKEKRMREKAESEKKKAESEKKELERRSVLALRKAGESEESIAELLDMSESEKEKAETEKKNLGKKAEAERKKEGEARQSANTGILGQWCDYLVKPHDPSENIDKSFQNNEGIQEVHEMLREFTENPKLMDLYRLADARMRQEQASDQVMREFLLKEKRMREKAESEREKAESEREKFESRSVLALRKAGESDKSIAGLLGMPENEVKRITDDQPGKE